MAEDVNKKIEDFFSKHKKRHFKKNEVFIFPGDETIDAFFIKKGFVRQYTILDDATELTFHIFHPTKFFPLMWVISGLKNRYYYEAITDVELLQAPGEELNKFVRSNPDVLMSVTDGLLFGINKLLGRIEQLVSYTAYERTISSLLFLASHFGVKEGGKTKIDYKLKHIDIANFAGIKRETASRSLEKLRKSGLITYQGRDFVINNTEKLTSELKSPPII